MRRTPLLTVFLILPSVSLAQDACELQRLVSPPEVPTSSFAERVVTNGQQWLIADSFASTACGGPPIECGTGAIFSYDMSDGVLVHRQTILPPDTRLYESVGAGLDVDGSRLIVGIPGKIWPGASGRTGAAYIYEFDGGQWVESIRIQPPPVAEGGFGAVVLLDGDTALVRQVEGDRIHRYRRTGDNWEHLQILASPDSVQRACFGCSMVSADGWYFISAFTDASSSRDGGSVYVYRQSTDGTLDFVQKIIPDDVGYFGAGLDFNGQTLVVGAPITFRDYSWQGVAQTYELDGDRWVLQQEIVHSRPAELGYFGWTARFGGDRLLITTHGEYDPWIVRGMTYSYTQHPDGTWREENRLVPTPVRWAGQYGSTMASDGRHALIGAFDDQRITGGVVGAGYLFDLECGACSVDLDADGSLTIFDFLSFQNLFEDGDAAADFDGDGELTIFDFLAFQTAFDAGCE